MGSEPPEEGDRVRRRDDDARRCSSCSAPSRSCCSSPAPTSPTCFCRRRRCGCGRWPSARRSARAAAGSSAACWPRRCCSPVRAATLGVLLAAWGVGAMIAAAPAGLAFSVDLARRSGRPRRRGRHRTDDRHRPRDRRCCRRSAASRGEHRVDAARVGVRGAFVVRPRAGGAGRARSGVLASCSSSAPR